MTHPYGFEPVDSAADRADPGNRRLFYLPAAGPTLACGLMFAAAGITDSFDSYTARRLSVAAQAFLDPV